jgi:tetratricopeptide (TPR) repeat protein
MSEERTLIEEMEDIYYVWDYVSKEKAKDMLQKIYFQRFARLKNIEEQRIVLHNLTTVIMQIREDMNSAKFYSKVLKDILDNYPNYLNTQLNKERYCRALNNYTECYKEELSKEELIKIYKFCFDTYKDYKYNKINEYLEKIIAEFNLNLTSGNYNQVLIILENLIIHNNTPEYKEELKIFMNDIKNTNQELYIKAQVLLSIKTINIKTM